MNRTTPHHGGNSEGVIEEPTQEIYLYEGKVVGCDNKGGGKKGRWARWESRLSGGRKSTLWLGGIKGGKIRWRRCRQSKKKLPGERGGRTQLPPLRFGSVGHKLKKPKVSIQDVAELAGGKSCEKNNSKKDEL